jgi:thioredoxin
MIEQLTSETFDARVAQSPSLVVDFFATWCQPCHTFDVIVQEVADEGIPPFQFARVDVGADPELAARFSIASVPALVILRDGVPVRKLFGAKPKRQLVETLRRYLD